MCATNTISKVSQKWLTSLNKVINREYKIRHESGFYVVDGYDPFTNTVYEFYGDYWHGNPQMFKPEMINQSLGKTFGELYKNTITREENLKKMGFNLITIWESEYYAKKSF